MLRVRGPMMVHSDYTDAGMKVGVWQKDMGIITEFARKLDCPTRPCSPRRPPFYNAAMALGFAEADTACVCAVLKLGDDTPAFLILVAWARPDK